VAVDTPHLALHPTYIDRLSQRSFTLLNRSAVPVRFAVRAMPGGGWEEEQGELRPLQLQAADEELSLLDDITQVPRPLQGPLL
jgi:hypothetical protein